jgi:hypothetical protein
VLKLASVPYSAFIRGGGLAAVLAGVLFAAWGFIHKDSAPASFTVLANALAFIVPLLFLLGLAGLYARCKGQAGWLGVTGFAFGCIGSAEGMVYTVVDLSFWYAYIAEKGWLSLLLDWLSLLLAGLMLVGIATIWTEALRRWGALLLTMGTFGWAYSLTDTGNAVEMRPGHVVFGILFSLSWVVLGYALYRTVDAAERDTTTLSTR